ncbi:hypothetical protein [Pseudomonas fluorescens]|uniref:hypothetical protein n=1 Tax=Pseudomonas fluorescens TaxID=294 RepID=UPI001472C182|nr:hypothetical protein [Pseudomonas fluorescens]NNB67639.1 hypothetical protein [Pseudomonas fluorescens]
MKIVEIVERVELSWSNDRWNLSLSGSEEGLSKISQGLIYERIADTYIGQNEGLVAYCIAGTGGACGGHFKMHDGSVEEVAGAWSSNSYSIFKATGFDSVAASFNNRVISLSIPALQALGKRFGFVTHEVAGTFRHNITPIPPAKNLSLVDRS